MNRVYEMTGDHMHFNQKMQSRIKKQWGDKRKVLDIVAEYFHKQTTYEGLGGEQCSRLDREEYGCAAMLIGFLLGKAKTPQEFFDQVEKT